MGDWNINLFGLIGKFLGNINMLCSGMHFGWVSPTLPLLLDEQSSIPTTDDEGSWIAVLFLVGSIFGALSVGLLTSDKIGRKSIILLSSGPFFISWIMLAFGQSVYVLMAARFISGIANGFMFSILPLYICEIANPNVRGFLGSTMMMFWIFGTLIMDVLGSHVTITTAALISSTVPLISFVTFCWMPESPYYFIIKGKLEKAKRSLIKLQGTEDVEDELRRLVEVVEEQIVKRGNFLDLFTIKSNRKSLMISLGTRTVQQLTGACAITFYIQIIFKDAGDLIAPSTCSLIYFMSQFIACGFSSAIVDKVGRKPLMAISLTGCFLALSTLGCYFYIQNLTTIDASDVSILPVISLIIFVIAFNVGLQAVPIIMSGELFATNIKTLGMSLGTVYFAVVVTLVSKFFQITKDHFGLHIPFFIFSICCVFGLLFIILYVPETKGKTLQEIQAELKGEQTAVIEESRDRYRNVLDT